MIAVFANVILPVLLILTFGILLGKFSRIDVKTLSTLSLYLLTPALIFQALYPYEGLFNPDVLRMLGLNTLLVVIIIAVVEIGGRLLKIEKPVRIALVLTLSLPNTGNFGLPINEYAYGAEGLYVASIVLVIYSFFTNTLGVFVAASDKQGAKEAFKRMISIPFFYVVVLAVLLNYFKVEIPDSLFDPIQKVGLAAIPLNLIQLGINLARVDLKKLKKNLPTVLIASVAKLVLIPLGAYFLLLLFGMKGLEFNVTLTQIAMPPAVYCSILASHYDADADLTSSIVFSATIISLITLSILITILTGGNIAGIG